MGRVYNALKRAGAWSDRGHPTGRPNRVSHPRPWKRQRRPELARAGEYDWAKELGYAAAAAPAAAVEPIVPPAAAVEPAAAPADKSIVAADEPVTPAMPDILAKCGLARISVRTLD